MRVLSFRFPFDFHVSSRLNYALAPLAREGEAGCYSAVSQFAVAWGVLIFFLNLIVCSLSRNNRSECQKLYFDPCQQNDLKFVSTHKSIFKFIFIFEISLENHELFITLKSFNSLKSLTYSIPIITPNQLSYPNYL